MEVAGGAIAVISLGIQLVGTVQKASRFVQSIRDAPKELSTFGSSLELLHLTLKKVVDLIDQQDEVGHPAGATDQLELAVRNCESNVTCIGELVDRLRKRFHQKGRYRNAWASFNSVLKKDDLDRFRYCVQEDLVVLNTALTSSVYQLQ